MDRLTEKLKTLQNIVPSDDFAFSTKFSILASARPSTNIKFAIPGIWAGSAVMAVVILIVALITDLESPSVTRSVAEIAAIESVAASFEHDISITLKEISAYKDSAAKTAAALHEASSNGPASINSLLIKREFDALNIDYSDQEEIDQLLQRAIF